MDRHPDAVEKAEALTVSQVHALERSVEQGIDTLEREYRHRPSIGEIHAALCDLNVDVAIDCGRVTLPFSSVEEILTLGFLLAQREPRIASYVIDTARCDFETKVISWGE